MKQSAWLFIIHSLCVRCCCCFQHCSFWFGRIDAHFRCYWANDSCIYSVEQRKKICKISCAVVRWKTTDITGSNSNIEMYTIYFNILTDCVSVCIHGVHSVRKTYLSAGIYLLWIESTGFVYFCFLFVSFLYSRMNIGARLE